LNLSPVELFFERGTLLLKNVPETLLSIFPQLKWDERVLSFRTPAFHYYEIALYLHQEGFLFQDDAKKFEPTHFQFFQTITPRNYQQAALNQWLVSGKRGVVTLPTGAGKTMLAMLCIKKTSRPTLVHVPTIDLMQQWHGLLEQFFGTKVGRVGGGFREWEQLTVSTYDSAILQVEYQGNQYGLLIFDECHHLPGEQFQYAAAASMAPFRLGLTATPERSDGKEALLYEICGPLVYQVHIDELEGRALAPYRVQTIEIELTSAEQDEYQRLRNIFLNFIRRERIRFDEPNGWHNFLFKSSRSVDGKEAFQAYLAQKKLSQASGTKLEQVWKLLTQHIDDRVILFTQDNEMAYKIGREFLLPVLTHQTKGIERDDLLNKFRDGAYPTLVTSKVLNEGVDVPEANVAIVVSGSGSTREHVQRLGRILRARPKKEAILYELVSKGTAELYVSQRRRQHRAYDRYR
jgi:superfamily II DNA or RNA helicase